MNQKYMNEELANLKEEEVWDRFTSLKEEEMADMQKEPFRIFLYSKSKTLMKVSRTPHGRFRKDTKPWSKW